MDSRADAISMDSDLPEGVKSMYEAREMHEQFRSATNGIAVQNRQSRMYRPWLYSSQVVAIMQHNQRKINRNENRDSFYPGKGCHFLNASYLAVEMPHIRVKDPKTCQIRLKGDLHPLVEEAELVVGRYRFPMSRVSLDSGLHVPRHMREEYERAIKRTAPPRERDLREWASEIPGGEEVPFPQMWPYCVPYESVPLYTEVEVVHNYKFDLRVSSLFEMRVKTGKDWDIIEFDPTRVDGPAQIKRPDMWGQFETLEERDLEEIAAEPVEKRWKSVLVQKFKNPAKGGSNVSEILRLRDSAHVLGIGWGAVDVAFRDVAPEVRYLTSDLRAPASEHQIMYGNEPRVTHRSTMHSVMQQFFRMSEPLLTPGFGFHSFANHTVGAETPSGVANNKIELHLTLRGDESTQYDVYALTQTLRALIFKKPDEWDRTDAKRVRLRGEDIVAESHSPYKSAEATSFYI